MKKISIIDLINGTLPTGTEFEVDTKSKDGLLIHAIDDKSKLLKILNDISLSFCFKGKIGFDFNLDSRLVFDSRFNFEGGLQITGDIKNGIRFENCSMKELDFYDIKNSKGKGVNIEIVFFEKEKNKKLKFNIDKIEISNSSLEGLMIYNRMQNDFVRIGTLELKNSILQKNEKGDFIANLMINNLSFVNFSNLSEIFKIVDIDVERLHIRNSTFGKTSLNNSVFKKVKMKGPVLTECIFNNTDFIRFEKGESSNKEMKDIYRQMKFVMDKNGNFTEGNRFFAKEMDYYGKDLEWSHDFANKFIFKLQQYISDFGNNWWLPVMWVIVLGFIYTYLELSKNFIYDFFNFYKANKFWEEMIKNINPFDKKIYENLTIFLLLFKIMITFLYYHLIVALKRLTKR